MEAKVSAARSQLEALRAEKAARSRTHKKAEKAKADAKVESVRRRVQRLAGEPALLQARRDRMASEAGQTLYRRRLRVEAVNGVVKGGGLGQLPVRGLEKVRAVAHNLWRVHRLACAA